MDTFFCCFPFLIAFGVVVVLRADRHRRHMAMLRRDGVRAAGRVIGHDDRPKRGRTTFTPVVSYLDADGAPHEFRMNLVTDRTYPPVGTEVPVLHIPGRPELAAVDSAEADAAGYRSPLTTGLFIIGIGVVLALLCTLRFISRIEVS